MNYPNYGPGRPLPGSVDEAAARILHILESAENGQRSAQLAQAEDIDDPEGGRNPTQPKPILSARINPVSASRDGGSVVYQYADGHTETWSGGTASWRTNNPGNMHYDQFAPAHGAIGKFGAFAVFPNESTGSSALNAWLHKAANEGATLNSMMERYAPRKENNTTAYQSFLSKVVGVPGDTLLRDLTAPQMRALLDGIVRFEGWRVGTITRTEAPAQ